MKKAFRKMMLDQVQADVQDPAELAKKPTPPGGWLQVIRTVLGMTTQQLAKRLGCTQSNVASLERREREGTISLKALEEAARAMDCKLIYFLVPNKPFETLLEEQARRIAQQRMRSVSHSMELENQGLNRKQREQQENELVKELLEGNPRALWEDEDEI